MIIIVLYFVEKHNILLRMISKNARRRKENNLIHLNFQEKMKFNIFFYRLLYSQYAGLHGSGYQFLPESEKNSEVFKTSL